MPILVYFGNPRQGKSYSAVADRIIPQLAAGRHVVTNVEGMGTDAAKEAQAAILRDRYKFEGEPRLTWIGHSDLGRHQIFPVDCKRELADGTREFDDTNSIVKKGSLLVWDEAKAFNTKELPELWYDAITYHGHWDDGANCVDMVLIVHSWKSLAPLIRSTAEVVFEIVKKADGKSYTRFEWASPGDRALSRKEKGVLDSTHKFDHAISKCYKTNASGGEANDNIAVKFSDSDWYKKRMRWIKILGAATVLWLAGVFFFGIKPRYIDGKEEQPMEVIGAEQAAPGARLVAATVDRPRIVGSFPTAGGLVALVEVRGELIEVETVNGAVQYQGEWLEWPDGF